MLTRRSASWSPRAWIRIVCGGGWSSEPQVHPLPTVSLPAARFAAGYSRPARTPAARGSLCSGALPAPVRAAPIRRRLAGRAVPRSRRRSVGGVPDIRPRLQRFAIWVGSAGDWTAAPSVLRQRVGRGETRMRVPLRRGDRRACGVSRLERFRGCGGTDSRLCSAAGVAGSRDAGCSSGAWYLLEGLNEQAIAARLGVSQPAVSKRLKRILAELRRELGVENTEKSP